MANTSVQMDEAEAAAETSSGLDENVAGALAYVFGFVTGLVLYFVEQDSEFVRFHAAQSIAVFGVVAGASIALSIVGTVMSTLLFAGDPGGFVVFSLLSLVLSLVWLVVGVASFGLWLYLMIRAYQGETPRVPVAAGIADRLV